MRRFLAIAVLLLAGLIIGCSWSDLAFSVFEGAYTEGGLSTQEKKFHYDETLRRYRESNIE